MAQHQNRNPIDTALGHLARVRNLPPLNPDHCTMSKLRPRIEKARRSLCACFPMLCPLGQSRWGRDFRAIVKS